MMSCELALAAALLAPAQADRRPAVDEQIEVMRALLIRRLGRAPSTYSWSYDGSNNLFSGVAPGGGGTARALAADLSNYVGQAQAPGYRWTATAHEAAVEGTYLDGYGAVFAVTLPPTDHDPRPGADGSKAPAGLSDWEREQRQLRGEPLPEQPARVRQGQSVGDVVLKLLADNGKHFTGLKPDERVTIAVTFRGPPVHAPVRVTTSALGQPQRATAYGAPAPVNPAAEPQSARDLALLGDLHLKQGQPQQAVEAYQKALKMIAADTPTGAAALAAEYYAKLAQAYAAAGKLDEARDALDHARDERPKTAQPAKAKAPPQVGPPRLPARLTISAPKKLLDDVGGGKVSYDEFRKQATVEYVAAGKAAE